MGAAGLQSFVQQVIRDMQAIRVRAGVLVVLFLLGLSLWISPFYHAIVDESSPSGIYESATEPPPLAIVVETSFADDKSKSHDAVESAKQADARGKLETDPLVLSAETAAMGGQLILHPRVAQNRRADLSVPTDQETSAHASSSASSGGLELKSTIIGVNRRAAYINRKLYFEGATVEYNDNHFELIAVHPEKVVLRQGNRVFELVTSGSSPVRQAESDSTNPSRTR